MSLPDLHNYVELLTPAVLAVLGWAGKTWSQKMHLENQAILGSIDKKITSVEHKIDSHAALDNVIHDDMERRLGKLER